MPEDTTVEVEQDAYNKLLDEHNAAAIAASEGPVDKQNELTTTRDELLMALKAQGEKLRTTKQVASEAAREVAREAAKAKADAKKNPNP